MLRLKPRNRKVRAGPRRRYAYLGTDEGAGRDYFLSGPHVLFVRCGTAPHAARWPRTTANIRPSDAPRWRADTSCARTRGPRTSRSLLPEAHTLDERGDLRDGRPMLEKLKAYPECGGHHLLLLRSHHYEIDV